MTEGERLKALRETLGIKQGLFADKISTTQGHISDIENGRKSLSERTIALICLKFNVNEDWLRTGNGEMFVQLLDEDELAAYCGTICAGKRPFLEKVILEYMRLDEESQKVIDNFISALSK